MPKAPVFSNIHVLFPSAESAIVRWQTQRPADSAVDYGTYNDYGHTSETHGSLVWSHAIVLSPLHAATSYTYRVRSQDQAGRETVSKALRFTTPAAGAVVNVRDHGAVGDGATDDTAAVQTAMQAVPLRGTLYFPAGTYLISATQGIEVANRRRMTWKGDGPTSILKRSAANDGDTRLGIFTNASDMQISDMAFDANGILAYGGMAFYDAQRVLITRTRFFDSNPQPHGSQDRYSFVFGAGRHEDIWLADNAIEDLQLEVDGVQRAHIIRNTLLRPWRTAGIGVFSLEETGGVAEDYEIAYNTITDSGVTGGAIVVDMDPPYISYYRFSRITMAQNRIKFVTVPGRAFLFGTPNNSVASAQNVFEDFLVDNNLITYKAALTWNEASIQANSYVTAAFDFLRLTLRRNIIVGPENTFAWAVDLRRMADGLVEDNIALNWGEGFSVHDLGGTVVRNNRHE